jgi:Major Facilitator Superfamily
VVTAVLALFLFAAAVPTPLYAYYAATWHFSAVNLTVIFGVYAVALLATLLVAGSLSDAVGRRPVMLVGLALQAVAMVLFVRADGLAWLYAARIVQGIATGLVTAAVAAALIDLQPRPGLGALVNAVTPTFGLAAGALGAGALVQYAPAPTQLVFALVLAACVLLAGGVLAMREPVRRRRRPTLAVQLGLEPAVRPAFLAAVPCLVATWALGGFYLSLGPSLTLQLLHSTNRLAGAAAVGALTIAGGLASLAVRGWTPRRAMLGGCVALAVGAALTTAGIAAAGLGLFLGGSAVAGLGFGAAFLGAFRTLAGLAAPARRGELVAAVYVVAYLGFSVPAVAAGWLSTVIGLPVTALAFAVAVGGLALIALVATARTVRPAPAVA